MLYVWRMKKDYVEEMSDIPLTDDAPIIASDFKNENH